MDEGSRNGALLSVEARFGGPLGRAPLLGTLEDVLRKAPDTGHLSPYGTLYVRGEPGIWRGGSYTGDFEW